MKSVNLGLLLCFFIFCSCSTYERMSIDVLIPAEYSFEPEIKSVVLIDNADVYRDSLVHRFTLPHETFYVDTIWFDEFASSSIKALKNKLEERNFFDTVYTCQLKNNELLYHQDRSLNWNLVDSICQAYNAESIITLDDYMYNTEINIKKYPEGYFWGYLDAKGAIFWRGFNNLTKGLQFQKVQRDTISWDATQVTLNKLASELPNIKNSLNELSTYMGNVAADLMTPYWETQNRGFYSSGSFEFLQAGDYVRKDKWGEAIKLWKYIFEHGNRKNKFRSAYNLALASEILGDYKAAEIWIKEAYDTIDYYPWNRLQVEKKRIEDYKFYIEKRLQAVSKLKTQVGGIE